MGNRSFERSNLDFFYGSHLWVSRVTERTPNRLRFGSNRTEDFGSGWRRTVQTVRAPFLKTKFLVKSGRNFSEKRANCVYFTPYIFMFFTICFDIKTDNDVIDPLRFFGLMHS